MTAIANRIDESNDVELMNFLQTVDANILTEGLAVDRLLSGTSEKLLNLVWTPVIERKY